MSAPVISSIPLICAGRDRRATLMTADHGRSAASHVTEFQDGMSDRGRRELARGQLLALPALDATLLCLEGELWLTRDGDIEDYILGAGSHLHLQPGDRAVVLALKASRLRLVSA